MNQFLAPEELKRLNSKNSKPISQVSHDKVQIKNENGISMGQAEVTRDEFGGYCCKRWGTGEVGDEQSKRIDSTANNSTNAHNQGDSSTEDNICKLLGLDIDKTALEIVKADFKRKKIPLSKAGKYLAASNPYSAHNSAQKSYNASSTKTSTKPIPPSSQDPMKDSVAEVSAFLTYEDHSSPYKRPRGDSHTFAPATASPAFENCDQSPKSAKN